MPFRNRDKESSREIIPLIDFPCERNWVVTYFPPLSPCYTTSTNRRKMQKNIVLPLLPPTEALHTALEIVSNFKKTSRACNSSSRLPLLLV